MVINCGSSSLKFQITNPETGETHHRGIVERVGNAAATLTLDGRSESVTAPDHTAAMRQLAARLPLESIAAVGHRVVHGGERFRTPVRIGPEVMRTLQEMAHLAPLHNPANIQGIRAAAEVLPGLPMVAVFDTAFHATLPERAYLYAIESRFYTEHGIRRYGFHGTSHEYVTGQLAQRLGQPLEDLRVISLHLGNGASAAAVKFGRSVDTSMGFTPLEGLVMGTRSGDLDPAVALWIAERGGVEHARELLNKRSGLLGLSGVSNDLRDLRRAAGEGNRWAQRALEVMSYRLTKTVGAYAAAMGGLNAVVFTGGVGENDADTRAEALAGLEFLGIELDAQRNASRGEARISADSSRVAVWVIPTDEELLIARKTLEVLSA
nr:acetate kinase [Deinobacterium chartae]